MALSDTGVTPAASLEPAPPAERRWAHWRSGCLALLLSAALGAWVMLRTVQTVPEFYQQAAAEVARPELREQAVQVFEQKLSDLRDQIEQELGWEQTFSQQEINSWLAEETRKTPELLPRDVHRPLIVIDEDRFQLGVEVRWEDWTGIVSLEGTVEVPAPRTLWFRLQRVRLGDLNLSMDEVRRRVKPQLEEADSPSYQITWIDGTPEPILEVELIDPETARYQLSEVVLSPEQITVRGETTSLAERPGS